MKSRKCFFLPSALLIAAVVALTGCTTPHFEHVVDYQIIGDRSVKYIVIPTEKSQAGSMYLDSNVSLEICDIEPLPSQAGSANDEEAPVVEGTVEKGCRQTRVLRTQEYR